MAYRRKHRAKQHKNESVEYPRKHPIVLPYPIIHLRDDCRNHETDTDEHQLPQKKAKRVAMMPLDRIRLRGATENDKAQRHQRGSNQAKAIQCGLAHGRLLSGRDHKRLPDLDFVTFPEVVKLADTGDRYFEIDCNTGKRIALLNNITSGTFNRS